MAILRITSNRKILMLVCLVALLTLSGCMSSGSDDLQNLTPSITSATNLPVFISTSPITSTETPTTIQETTLIPATTPTPLEINTPTKPPTPALTPMLSISGWIVFSDQSTFPASLSIIQVNGTGQRNIFESDELGLIRNPVFSPDGNWIAFLGTPSRSIDDQIYLIRPDGSNLKQLTTTPGYKNSFSWAPDGKAIVYSETTSIGDKNTVDLFILEIDPLNIRQLTDSPDISEHAPRYSPIEKSIVFAVAKIIDQSLVFELMSIGVDGSDIQQIEFPKDVEPFFSWSPNSSRIVFASGEKLDTGLLSCNTDLYMASADGSKLHRLTDTTDNDSYPVWSPEGNSLAFTRAPCDSGTSGFQQIYLIHVESLVLRKITEQSNLVIEGLAWSPWPAFQVGRLLTITELGDDLNLRSSPALSATILEKLKSSEKIMVLEGPVENDEYLWWRVRVESSEKEGWVADNPGWFTDK
jgi:Tol biopolymer transport system component